MCSPNLKSKPFPHTCHSPPRSSLYQVRSQFVRTIPLSPSAIPDFGLRKPQKNSDGIFRMVVSVYEQCG